MSKKGIVGVLLALLFLACNNKEMEKKIGIVAPLTGEGATYGSAMKRGFDLAFEDIKEYKLIYEDTKLNPKDGINAINKLINFDKVELIFGAASSSVTLAIAPEAEKNKKVLLSSISTADDITYSGDYIFRNVPSNYVQGITAANFLMNELNVTRVAVLKENDDYGISLASSFAKQINKNGGNITVEESYVSTDVDFKIQLIKVINSKPEALFIPGNYEESALILKQAKELGLNIPIIGGDGSYSNDLINVAGIAAENFYCTHFGVNKDDSFYLDFRMKFLKIYNEEPNVYEAYAYEAGSILLEAMKDKPFKSEEIKYSLLNTTFNSLTGKLVFDKNGDVERQFGVLKVVNGEYKIYK